MRWRSFFKTMVIGLFLATACLANAYAKDGLTCDKGSECRPMMDTWCQQNKDTIIKNASEGGYKYLNPMNCDNPLCCLDVSMYKCEYVDTAHQSPVSETDYQWCMDEWERLEKECPQQEECEKMGGCAHSEECEHRNDWKKRMKDSGLWGDGGNGPTRGDPSWVPEEERLSGDKAKRAEFCKLSWIREFKCKSVLGTKDTIQCQDEVITTTLEKCKKNGKDKHVCHTLRRYGFSEATEGKLWGGVKYVSCEEKGEEKGISLFVEGLLDLDTSGCWLCPLLERVFVQGDKLATAVYRKINRGMLWLLGVWAALLILWTAFRVFVDFSGKEARSFIQKMLGLVMRVIVVAVLLGVSPRVLGEWVFDPFISLSTGLGLNIINSAGETNHPQITYLMKNLDNEDSQMGCTNEADKEFWKNPDLMFTKSSCNAVVGLIDVLSTEMLTPMQFGQTLMRWSWLKPNWGIFPNMTPLMTGLIIVAFFFWALIMLPFKVIDTFVQLAVVGCLSPLALTLFAFPVTRSYTQGVWKMFLSCMIQLVMLSLMVALSVALFLNTIDDNVLGLFLANKNEEAFRALGLGGTGLLIVLSLAYLAVKLIDAGGTYAQQLGGGVDASLGQALEAPVRGVSARAAGLAAGAVWGGIRRIFEPRAGDEFQALVNARRAEYERRRGGGYRVDMSHPNDIFYMTSFMQGAVVDILRRHGRI